MLLLIKEKQRSYKTKKFLNSKIRDALLTIIKKKKKKKLYKLGS